MYYCCICDFEIWGCSPDGQSTVLCKNCPNPCHMAKVKIKEGEVNKLMKLRKCPTCEGPSDGSYRHVNLTFGEMEILNDHFQGNRSWIFSKHY